MMQQRRGGRINSYQINSYQKVAYGVRWLPAFLWQSLSLRGAHRSKVHLIIALADHFEPAIHPRGGQARASYAEQQGRLETWCHEYPKAVSHWRDNDGFPFVHTYFYPAEQYERFLIERLAQHCHAGWGEIEVHLHHGTAAPDTEENTRNLLLDFRDALARRHSCLCYEGESDVPRYAFVHGNFALANSAGGMYCGVDSEMQVLSDTGCYADMTLPVTPGHPAQTAKINSLYECTLPLGQQAPQRKGRDLMSGIHPRVLPLIIQGPLLPDFTRFPRRIGVENGSITRSNPLTLARLRMWKRAAITIKGRPDWLFIKLHCHSMDPTQTEVVRGAPMRKFLQDLVRGADNRGEILHFVTAREMVNIIFAACDGREGNPGDYRDYSLRRRTNVVQSRSAMGSRKALND